MVHLTLQITHVAKFCVSTSVEFESICTHVPQGPPSWTQRLHTSAPKQPSPPSAHPTQSTVDTYHEFMMYMYMPAVFMYIPVTHVLGNLMSPSPEFESTLGLSAASVNQPKMTISPELSLIPTITDE